MAGWAVSRVYLHSPYMTINSATDMCNVPKRQYRKHVQIFSILIFLPVAAMGTYNFKRLKQTIQIRETDPWTTKKHIREKNKADRFICPPQ